MKYSAIALDRHAIDVIDREIEGGEFRSPTGVVQTGLQLLEERQAKVDALRAAIIEGEESGPPEPFDLDEFLSRMHRERGCKPRA